MNELFTIRARGKNKKGAIYVIDYVYEDELRHHGIDGMRWGKRNGPPYPLRPEDHSAAEKKAAQSNSHYSAKSNEKSGGESKAADLKKNKVETNSKVNNQNNEKEKLAEQVKELVNERRGKSSDYLNSRRTDFDNMSNEELRNLVNRLQLEKQYSDITKTDKNAELRDVVNRLQLEKQYKDLTQKRVTDGRTFVTKTKDAFNTVAGFSDSALKIYKNYKEFKKILGN